MARWATLGFLAVFVIGVIVGIASSGNATAQDTDTAHIEALETQVAELYQHDETLLNNYYDLANRALPGVDPNGEWQFGNYLYDRTRYQFSLICSINDMGGGDYAMNCTQPQPFTP